MPVSSRGRRLVRRRLTPSYRRDRERSLQIPSSVRVFLLRRNNLAQRILDGTGRGMFELEATLGRKGAELFFRQPAALLV